MTRLPQQRQRGCALALRQLAAIRAQHHRQVGEDRPGSVQRVEEHSLFGRVGQVAHPPDDVGDAHGDVVHHDGEVVGGASVRAHDHEVAELAGRKGDRPKDLVAHHDLAVRDMKSRHRTSSLPLPPGALLRGQGTAGPRIAKTGGSRPFRIAEAGVGQSRVHEPPRGLGIAAHAFALPVRAEVSAHLRAFVPLHPEPAQVFQDGFERVFQVALDVGVLHAQDEDAPVMARKCPVEDGHASVSRVQPAGGTGGETGANGHIAWSLAGLDMPTCPGR